MKNPGEFLIFFKRNTNLDKIKRKNLLVHIILEKIRKEEQTHMDLYYCQRNFCFQLVTILQACHKQEKEHLISLVYYYIERLTD